MIFFSLSYIKKRLLSDLFPSAVGAIREDWRCFSPPGARLRFGDGYARTWTDAHARKRTRGQALPQLSARFLRGLYVSRIQTSDCSLTSKRRRRTEESALF